MFRHQRVDMSYYSCYICGVDVKRKYNFKRHLRNIHGLYTANVTCAITSPAAVRSPAADKSAGITPAAGTPADAMRAGRTTAGRTTAGRTNAGRTNAGRTNAGMPTMPVVVCPPVGPFHVQHPVTVMITYPTACCKTTQVKHIVVGNCAQPQCRELCDCKRGGNHYTTS